jgi:CPA2 family monovalent cation:H+ antiporter-2
MHGFEFLDEIVLLCVVAVAVIVLFNRIRIPPIIGLIVTGLLLGPSGFKLVAQTEMITAISELGVILLLFAIGLEFSLDDLKQLRSIVLVGGPLQVGVSSILIGGTAYVLAAWAGSTLTIGAAVLIGMAMALSSTAMCMKILKDRRELGMPHGRTVLGILIFQDIAVVPMVIIVSLFSPAAVLSAPEIATRLGAFIAVTAALIVSLRFFLPRIIPYVTRVSAPEVLILGGLALCFGAAWITSMAGVSMALGAFIAGVAIAGSDEGHAIGRVLQPLRDAFSSMFFLSIGLLVTVSWEWMPAYAGTALAILVMNAVATTLVLLIVRVSVRTAIISSIILAQVGEFSFVLASTGFEQGIISSADLQHMLVSIIITMIVTPFMIRYAPGIADRLLPAVRALGPVRHWIDSRVETSEREVGASPTNGTQVTILGGGVLGTTVAMTLREMEVSVTILEMNGSAAQRLRADGFTVIQGDMTDEHSLLRAGVGSAAAVIVAVSDHSAITRGIREIRALRPDILIIVRTRYAHMTDSIASCGADIVVTEEYESSIQVTTAILEHLGVDLVAITAQQERMRASQYGVLGQRRRQADRNTSSTGA